MTTVVVRHAWIVEVVRWAAVVSTGQYKCGPIAIERWKCDRCGKMLPENHAAPPWWSGIPSSGEIHLVDCEGT